MTTIVEKTYTLLYVKLLTQSPVLSGNMRHHIKAVEINPNRATIMITAPSYDVNKWRKTGAIIFTHKFNYASIVNELGGFAKRNKSMHWVNRACVEIAEVIANEIGAEVINELPL